jgi:hypothetical protein
MILCSFLIAYAIVKIKNNIKESINTPIQSR